MSQLLRELHFLLAARRRRAQETRRISVAIPTFNRVEELQPALPALLADGRVAEVVILDDASEDPVWRALESRLSPLPAKVRLHRNPRNLGPFANKARAVSLCSEEWVVLLDSDNRITPRYLDRLFSLPVWSPRVIYCPERARPVFDYRLFSGCALDLAAVRELLARPPGFMNAFLGTGNYFVHRRSYCGVLEPHGRGVGRLRDVNYANYLWLKSGGLLYVLPGLDYLHTVHGGSNYKQTSKEGQQVTDGVNAAIRDGGEYLPPRQGGGDGDEGDAR